MPVPVIAVAVLDDGSIAPHAGRASRWQMYAVDGPLPEAVWTLQLTRSGSLHEWHVRASGDGHPLHTARVAIAASAGDGVIRRLAERGTQLVTTSERDPLQAVCHYLAGRLPAGLPHKEAECLDPDHRHAVSGQ